MRLILTILGSLALAGVTFVGGLAAATALLTAEPAKLIDAASSTADLWTSEPVRVDPARQDLERVGVTAETAAAPAERQVEVASASYAVSSETQSEAPALDAVTAPVVDPRHTAWCERRYRSYDASDDSYRPFSGGRRPCVSPYSGSVASPSYVSATSSESDVTIRYASDASAPAFSDDDHIRSCLARYRSYRPADNSYQPYSGGSRQQCE